MKQLRFLLLITLILQSILTQAQYNQGVYGRVTDRETGKVISGVIVRVDKLDLEVVSNDRGYFYISAPDGDHLIAADHAGFVSRRVPVTVDSSVRLSLRLEKDLLLDGVTTTNDLISESVLTDPLSGIIEVPIKYMSEMPNLLSVQDGIKSLHMLPGVDFAPDGGTDLFVRGSGAGQNLLMLDGAPVYSLVHAYGYFSYLDPAALNSIRVQKGVSPASQGGRVGSIVDMKSKRLGWDEDVYAHMSINPILFTVNASLPLSKSGASLSANFRRTYIDILLSPFLEGVNLAFGDIHTSLHLPLKNDDELNISYLYGSDNLKLGFGVSDSATNVEYEYIENLKNHTVTANYSRMLDRTTTLNAGTYFSNYSQLRSIEEFNLDPQPGEPQRILNSLGISSGEIGIHGEIEKIRDNDHVTKLGIQNSIRLLNTGYLTQERFTSSGRTLSSETIGSTKIRVSLEAAPYIEDTWRVNDKEKLNVGLRVPIYTAKGIFGVYPEPRISYRRFLDSSTTLKAAYGWTHQFVHLYNNGTSTFDNVIWIPSTNDLKPVSMHQVSGGMVKNLGETVQWLNDAYFKTSPNQLLYIIGDPDNFFEFEDNFSVGRGTTVGFESMIKKYHGIFTGWLGYTLSNATLMYEEINGGEPFPNSTDRRHQIKCGFMISVPQLIISSNFVFGTGSPFSIPVAKYRDIEGRTVLSFDKINNYRGISYNRVDVRVQYTWGVTEENHSLEFCLYNLAGRINPYDIIAQRNDDLPGSTYEAFNVFGFKLVPSLAYKLSL